MFSVFLFFLPWIGYAGMECGLYGMGQCGNNLCDIARRDIAFIELTVSNSFYNIEKNHFFDLILCRRLHGSNSGLHRIHNHQYSGFKALGLWDRIPKIHFAGFGPAVCFGGLVEKKFNKQCPMMLLDKSQNNFRESVLPSDPFAIFYLSDDDLSTF